MFWIAGLFLIGAVFTIANSRRDVARARRMKRTPTSFVSSFARSSAPLSGTVEIAGLVAAGPEGTFESPISRTPCVFCRLRVQERRAYSRSSSSQTDASQTRRWHDLSLAIHAVPFLVDDRSGATARISPERAAVPEVVKAHVTLHYGSHARGDEFLDAHKTVDPAGPTDTTFLAKSESETQLGSERYLEELLVPGDPLYAIGLARRPATDASGYRDAAPPVVELFGETGEDELLLAYGSERDASLGLRTNAILGWAMLAIAGVLAAIGALRMIM